MKIFEKYMAEEYEKHKMWEIVAESDRTEFVKDFPASDIENIKLDDFLFAKSGCGNPNSFCYRLFYGLKKMASVGQAKPDFCGIYLRNGVVLALSATFKKMFGDDYDAAFKYIKGQIVELLDAAEKDDYARIENIKLNSWFRARILMVYYPEKFIPVCTKPGTENYCRHVGLNTSNAETMTYKNIRLMELKNSVPQMRDWSGIQFMYFCVWLIENNILFNCNELKSDEFIVEAKKIEEELQSLNITGESRDAIVKVRVNQSVFRELLLNRYHKCCLCGVSNNNLLNASHIKPWADSEPAEKLDVNNGFLLCPNHDKLFDKGLISFDDEGRIMISDKLSDIDRVFMNVLSDMSIDLTEGNKKYLKYHRDNIFKEAKQ